MQAISRFADQLPAVGHAVGRADSDADGNHAALRNASLREFAVPSEPRRSQAEHPAAPSTSARVANFSATVASAERTGRSRAHWCAPLPFRAPASSGPSHCLACAAGCVTAGAPAGTYPA